MGLRHGTAIVVFTDLVASSCLVSITRPHHEDVGHGSEGGEVLDRLVSGAILSQTNGVVSHHKDGASLHGALQLRQAA